MNENEKRIDELKADLVQKALAYGIANETYRKIWDECGVTEMRMKNDSAPLSPLVEAAVRFSNLAEGHLSDAARALHREMLRQAKEEIAAEQPQEAKPAIRAIGEPDF